MGPYKLNIASTALGNCFHDASTGSVACFLSSHTWWHINGMSERRYGNTFSNIAADCGQSSITREVLKTLLERNSVIRDVINKPRRRHGDGTVKTQRQHITGTEKILQMYSGPFHRHRTIVQRYPDVLVTVQKRNGDELTIPIKIFILRRPIFRRHWFVDISLIVSQSPKEIEVRTWELYIV